MNETGVFPVCETDTPPVFDIDMSPVYVACASSAQSGVSPTKETVVFSMNENC